jgi:hypothetical protein
VALLLYCSLRETERVRTKEKGIVRDTTFTEETEKLLALKVPRQCPFLDCGDFSIFTYEGFA